MYFFFFKKVFDLLVSLTFLFLLLPLILFTILIIKLESPGPVFHYSKRVGLKSKIFLMPKFRTMKLNTPNVATHKLRNPERYITKSGKFLRNTSIDEIPQLISVLRGHMSLVGPRPALFNQYDLIKLRKSKKIDKILPGITGLAQIKGRDMISITKKIEYDYDYLLTRSFSKDLNILLITFLKFFSKKEISH